MCFSPAASFSASAGLAVVGVMTLLQVRRRQEFLFASIPILFSVQQMLEGLIWLVLLRVSPTVAEYWLTQSYIAFVGIVWPVIVPLSLWLIEPEPKHRNMLLSVMFAGVCIAVFTFYRILQFPVSAHIEPYCISYTYPVEQAREWLLLYVVATCGAFYCASNRSLMRIGHVNMIAFLVAYYFYQYDLASVWCFFAAIISGLIYFYFSRSVHAHAAAEENYVITG